MPSSDLRADIQALVDTFVGDLEELVRKAALETVAQALQPGVSPRAVAPAAFRRVGRATTAAAPKPTAPKPTSRARSAAKSGGRVRRTPAQIEAAGDRIVKHVEANAGAKAEEIRAALGLAKNEWTLTIKRLVDDGKLTSKGEKRSTQYFAKGATPRFGVIKRPGRGAQADAAPSGG